MLKDAYMNYNDHIPDRLILSLAKTYLFCRQDPYSTFGTKGRRKLFICGYVVLMIHFSGCYSSPLLFVLTLQTPSDPDNVLYDALALNRGLKETFFSPSTPLAFLTRFSKPNGAKELVEVLSKWNKGRLPKYSFCYFIDFSD